MEKPSRKGRLEQLRAKKAQSQRDNRRDVIADSRNKTVQGVDVALIERKKQAALDEAHRLEQGEAYTRKKTLEYSLEEWESWDTKQKNKAFENYSQLAEQSYKKEVALLDVDKADYEKKKQQLMNKYGVGADGLRNVVEVDQITSKEAKEKLVQAIEEGDERRFKRRKKESSGGHINQKNKDFNDKLDREYGRLFK